MQRFRLFPCINEEHELTTDFEQARVTEESIKIEDYETVHQASILAVMEGISPNSIRAA